MSDYLGDIRRWSELLKSLPEPIAYIVLDHSITGYVEDHDEDGRRYVRCSPAFLDEVKHVRPEFPIRGEAFPFGIPVYRAYPGGER